MRETSTDYSPGSVVKRVASRRWKNRRNRQKAGNIWEPLPGPQMMAYHSPADILGYGGSAGGGKASANSAIVWTPFGPKPMGEIRVGDQVCNPDGTIARVIGVFPQGVQDIYEVSFVDGAKTRVTADHIWLYWRASKRLKADRRYLPGGEAIRGRLATTDSLGEMLQSEIGNIHHTWPIIPLANPIIFTMPKGRGNKYPIDPYLLGILLGDGSFRYNPNIRITSADDFIIEAVKERVKGKVSSLGNYDFSLKQESGIAYHLEKMGLLGQLSYGKFVPKQYLTSSVESRFELLQGLMDTDGYIDSRGHCQFDSVSEQLALDVQFLARSLGAKATLNKGPGRYKTSSGEVIQCKDVYHIYIQSIDNSRFFKLPRKKKRAKPFNGGISIPGRRLVNIEYIGKEEATCIQVNHPNGLYITDDFIVTHNTDLLLGLASTQHHRSVIFRRVFRSMRGIIERSREVFNPENVDHSKDSYNESLHRWTLGGGKMLEFESCQYEKDRERQRGRPRDFYGFDEVTEFTKTQVEFIIAWNRSVNVSQRCRVVMTFNPPSDEVGTWICNFFLPWLAYLHPNEFTYPNPAKPGELRWFAMIAGDQIEVESGKPFQSGTETIYPNSRTFIPAKLEDNPYLEQTNYRAVLQSLSEPFRSQMLDGDFSATMEPDEWQVIPTNWIKLAMLRGETGKRVSLSGVSVDVARGGKDQTVISKRYGNFFAPLKVIPGRLSPNGPTVAAQVDREIGDEEPTYINVDVIGIGSSAYDSLDPMYDNPRKIVHAINVAEKSTYADKSGKYKMRNQRAEAWWRCREALDPVHGDGIILPDDTELLADLAAPRFSVTTAGIQVEEKENIKKRIGRSPDLGDAVTNHFLAPKRGIFFG